MKKKINFAVKELMVSLSGTCFWYWNSFYSFLDTCGVSKPLQQKYPRAAHSKYDIMRNILEDLEETNKIEVINAIISNFFRLKTAVDRDQLDEKKAKQLLTEFRDLVGNDPIEKEIKRQKQEKLRVENKTAIDKRISQRQQLEDLNALFTRLITTTEYTPQQRGYKLEEIFCDLLQISEMDYSKPYKTHDGEQIDGHFTYEKFDYLIETKWVDGPIKQKDLSIFDGKIKGKAQSTRGLFLAVNGFDENAINKYSGDSPRIILMTGEDLNMVLNGRILFDDAMKAKIEAIVRYGKINFPLRNI